MLQILKGRMQYAPTGLRHFASFAFNNYPYDNSKTALIS